MPEHIDPNQPLTIAQLLPWFAGAVATSAGGAIALFRWVFLTNVINEIKDLKVDIKALTALTADLNVRVAVLAKAVSDLEQNQRSHK